MFYSLVTRLYYYTGLHSTKNPLDNNQRTDLDKKRRKDEFLVPKKKVYFYISTLSNGIGVSVLFPKTT